MLHPGTDSSLLTDSETAGIDHEPTMLIFRVGLSECLNTNHKVICIKPHVYQKKTTHWTCFIDHMFNQQKSYF